MSHEYRITLKLDQQVDIRAGFLNLIEKLQEYNICKEIIRISLYEGTLTNNFTPRGERQQAHKIVEEITSKNAPTKSISLNDVENFISTFFKSNSFIKLWFLVERYIPDASSNTTTDILDFDPILRSVQLYLIGNDIQYGPKGLFQENDTGILYEVLDMKYYDTGYSSIWAFRNLHQLINELKIMALSGVDAISGLSLNDNENTKGLVYPEEGSIRYHQSPSGYWDDLQIMSVENEKKVLQEKDIYLAVEQVEDIEMVPFSQGLLIYSRLGTGGTLKNFYKALKDI